MEGDDVGLRGEDERVDAGSEEEGERGRGRGFRRRRRHRCFQAHGLQRIDRKAGTRVVVALVANGQARTILIESNAGHAPARHQGEAKLLFVPSKIDTETNVDVDVDVDISITSSLFFSLFLPIFS